MHLHDLRAFEMSEDRGFLPAFDPIDALAPWFSRWDELGRDLPKLLMTNQFRQRIESLPVLDFSQLESRPERERVMMLLCHFAQAYVWGAEPTPQRLPMSLSIPLFRASEYLGRPPILSHASYVLNNWRRLDPNEPIELGNIVCRQNLLSGQDEEWFVLVQVEIEAKAAPALAACGQILQAVGEDEPLRAANHLQTVAEALQAMCAALDRLAERCDPHIYSHRIRPFLRGWNDQPALGEGMIYDGAYEEKPQQFFGVASEQSSVIHSLYALLGIASTDEAVRLHLQQMRQYMPPAHRAFIEAIEAGPSLRDYAARRGDVKELAEIHQQCVELVHRFGGVSRTRSGITRDDLR